jgi:pumilio RNA-binding family
MVQMARHKFASNICEKALVMPDYESCQLLIEEIMTAWPGAVGPIILMMRDSFASGYHFSRLFCADSHAFHPYYVLLCALEVVEGEQRYVLEAKVRPQLSNMQQYPSVNNKYLASSTYWISFTVTGPS